ncbi:MAG: hypothetical protein OET63_04905 [Desulfobacterales bacterium]|nr:hypothetical protein [Desulfobacterales bacterium]
MTDSPLDEYLKGLHLRTERRVVSWLDNLAARISAFTGVPLEPPLHEACCNEMHAHSPRQGCCAEDCPRCAYDRLWAQRLCRLALERVKVPMWVIWILVAFLGAQAGVLLKLTYQ